MTRRATGWQVVAALFGLANGAGAGFAVAQSERSTPARTLRSDFWARTRSGGSRHAPGDRTFRRCRAPTNASNSYNSPWMPSRWRWNASARRTASAPNTSRSELSWSDREGTSVRPALGWAKRQRRRKTLLPYNLRSSCR